MIRLILLVALLMAPAISVSARDFSVASHAELWNAIHISRDGDTISLTDDITISDRLPHIDWRITVEGNGHSISGNNRYRIFVVARNGDLTINDLNLLDGRAKEGDPPCIAGAALSDKIGGAICSSGKLAISGSSFSGNSSGWYGGAILSYGGEVTVNESSFSENSGPNGAAVYSFGGEVTINDSSFSDNSAYYGAVYSDGDGASLSISGSSFSGNSAVWDGGAISSLDGDGASVVVSSSSFAGNSAARDGGAIYIRGGASLSVSDSSFSDNSAANTGGAIRIEGSGTLSNLTIANNSADETGGGLYLPSYAESVRLRNSILADNTGGDCVNGTDLAESLNNIIKDGSCLNATGTTADPMLGEWVAATDDSTGYFPLLAGSPAIDAAADSICTATDQHGSARPHGNRCDIGAIEYGSASAPQTISYGDSVGGNLTGSSAYHLYTFKGAAGDKIKISMIRVTEGIAPHVSLWDDGGAKLTENGGSVDRDALIASYSLPRAGEYSISANNFHDGRGYYSLSLSLLAGEGAPRVRTRFEVNEESAKAWGEYQKELIKSAKESIDAVTTGFSVGVTIGSGGAAAVPALIAETVIQYAILEGIVTVAGWYVDDQTEEVILNALDPELGLGCLGKVRSGQTANVYAAPDGEVFGQLGANATAIALMKKNNWFVAAFWDQDEATFKSGWLKLDDPALELQGSDCGVKATDPVNADLDRPWRVAAGCVYSNANTMAWLYAQPSEFGHKLALARPDDSVTVTTRDQVWLYVSVAKNFSDVSKAIRGYIHVNDVMRNYMSSGGAQHKLHGLPTDGPCAEKA